MFAFLLLLTTVASSTAFAESEDSMADHGYPASKVELEEATDGAIPIAMPEDAPTPVAAEEAEDLGRAEAEHLLQEGFGPAIEAPAKFLSDLDVEEFRSNHAAVVAPPAGAPSGATPSLLSSTLPLRVENESGQRELVDLDLERSAGDLEPENPIVDIEVPSQLSEGFSFPETEIEIVLAAPHGDRRASRFGDASAFFPNVETDTDFVVTAAPTGVETYTHLRSPEAPTKQVFEVSVPPLHQLMETQAGGAKLVAPDGSVVLSVTPPAALDSKGESVPADLKVEGETLVVSVYPAADAAYPILVDPLFESYNWTGSWMHNESDWRHLGQPGFYTAKGVFGASIYSAIGPTSPGNQGYWNYYVPRYWSDLGDPAVAEVPTSYIRGINLYSFSFRAYDRTNPYPLLQMGLFSDAKGEFVSFRVRYGTEGDLSDPGFIYHLPNPDDVTDVKRGGFALATWSAYNDQIREVFAGQSFVEVSDKDAPAFGELGSVSEWVDQHAGSAINYRVSDPGLGVHRLRLRYPAATGGTGETTTSLGCIGNGYSPCPRTASRATKPLTYSPNLMAQGEHFVKINAIDPINASSSTGHARVKVDHTGPEFRALSGSLTEQGTVGTNLSEYTLNYSASDGDDAPAAAQAPIGTQGTGPGQLERPTGVDVDANGNVWAVDRTNKRIVKYDKNGSFLSQFGVPGTGDGQLGDLRGIAVGPNGNLWVTQVGTKAVQQFTPAGAYVSKITNSAFSAVYGIAIAPNGVVWLADQVANRLYQYKEDGTLIRVMAGGSWSNSVPTAVDVDRFGNAWVTSHGYDQVRQVSPSGYIRFSFGSDGTGDGEFHENPHGIAVAESGNILVVDGTGQVQEFKPDGSFLRKFGTSGSGNGQFHEPREIAVGPGNLAYISDAGNHRIARWAHADKDPQSGVAKVEIKVDGTSVHTEAPGCSTKNCTLSGSWTLHANDYTGGAHKVEVIATDAVGIETTKTLDVETHGDGTNPTVALAGSMAHQASYGTTRPSYTLHVNAADPGPAEEVKSGVASTTIKVDGTVVDSTSPGCSAGGCSITREWTLNSENYSVGAHTVEVKATDAVGRSTVKTLQIEIARDTTAPVFELQSESLYSAPSGWVEQKSYPYLAMANDSGYGVVSMSLKIDGEVVASAGPETCPQGGCWKFLGWFQYLDMSEYDGGAHPAELIATDGAGNTRKRTWTIKVSPDGVVPPSEAEATVDALEETTSINLLDPTDVEANLEGTAPDLGIEEAAGGLVTTGGSNSTEVAADPDAGMVVSVAPPEALEGFCAPDGDLEPADEPTGAEEEELAEDPPVNCTPNPSAPDGSDPLLTPVEVAPTAVSPEASQAVLTDGEASAVATNVSPNIDLITRPLFDGAMTFAAIRDAAAADSFSWRVNLDDDQELKLIDNRNIAVYYEDGPVAFSITAVEAHDAVGTAVPTTLSISGDDVIVLTVAHRGAGPDGQPFVYPVVGGAGWEGGFQTYTIVTPPPVEQQEEPEEGGYSFKGGGVLLFAQGAPIHSANDPATAHLSAGSGSKKKKFKFVYCMPREFPGGANIAPDLPEAIPFVSGKNLPMIVSECNNPALEGIFWKASVHGWFHYIRGEWVWIKSHEFKCEKGGEERGNFAEINCRAFFAGATKIAGTGLASKSPIKMMGNWRFRSGSGQWGIQTRAICFTMGGLLDKTPNNVAGRPVQRPMIWERSSAAFSENCNWPGY